jgi:hypothetical protein
MMTSPSSSNSMSSMREATEGSTSSTLLVDFFER